MTRLTAGHFCVDEIYELSENSFSLTNKKAMGDFPGGPVTTTLCSQCKVPGFNPWSGNKISYVTTKNSHMTQLHCISEVKGRQNFPDKQKAKDFITNGSIFQEKLKEVLQAKIKRC